MSETLQELRLMPVGDLIARHDSLAGNTVVGTSHYLAEIHRRDNERVTNAMLRLTRWIFIMTIVVTASTIVNTVLFYLSSK